MKRRKEVTGLNRDEIVDILNDLYLVYPRLFKDIENPKRRDRYVGLYTKYIGEFKHIDVKKALDKYIASELGKNSPSMNDLIHYSKIERQKRESEEGSGRRRIETPEEVMANMFHQEMAKPHDKRDYDLLERTKYYVNLFQDPEAYKKHFGKSREEFERL